MVRFLLLMRHYAWNMLASLVLAAAVVLFIFGLAALIGVVIDGPIWARWAVLAIPALVLLNRIGSAVRGHPARPEFEGRALRPPPLLLAEARRSTPHTHGPDGSCPLTGKDVD